VWISSMNSTSPSAEVTSLPRLLDALQIPLWILLQHKLPCQVKHNFFQVIQARLHQQYDVLNLLQSFFISGSPQALIVLSYGLIFAIHVGFLHHGQ
jgi:hypothetical protein